MAAGAGEGRRRWTTEVTKRRIERSALGNCKSSSGWAWDPHDRKVHRARGKEIAARGNNCARAGKDRGHQFRHMASGVGLLSISSEISGIAHLPF